MFEDSYAKFLGVDDSLIGAVDITDDFMFSYVMQDKDICIETLRYLLPEVDICDIEYIHNPHATPETAAQKSLFPTANKHSVRLDVFYDNGKSVINVEMQTRGGSVLPKRARYHQASIDVTQLERGVPYSRLKPTYIIFICTSDPFGKGFYRYTYENVCREAPELALRDEAYKLFFNTNGTTGDISPKLREMLTYMRDTRAYPINEKADPLVKRIHQATESAKMSDEWRRVYVMYIMDQQDAEARGEARGEDKSRREMVLSMLKEGFPLETIARIAKLTIGEVAALKK